MHKKQLYEAPEAEELFVKIEGNFCNSPYDNEGYGTGTNYDGGFDPEDDGN